MRITELGSGAAASRSPARSLVLISIRKSMDNEEDGGRDIWSFGRRRGMNGVREAAQAGSELGGEGRKGEEERRKW